MKKVEFTIEFEVPNEYLENIEEYEDELVAIVDEEVWELRSEILAALMSEDN